MKNNPLLELEAFGQSIWMDFIRRGMISSGELQQWIKQDGVSGVTSNPSIFEKAIVESHDYDEAIRSLTRNGMTSDEIYQALTVEDIQNVADLLRPTYDRTHGQDGFVSLEVLPNLAHDTTGSIEEARRLWSLVDRPNSMIKVPATRDGLPAIQQLIGEGINVNITYYLACLAIEKLRTHISQVWKPWQPKVEISSRLHLSPASSSAVLTFFWTPFLKKR
jgi:transaldolase